MSNIAKALQVVSQALETHLQTRQKRAEDWVVVSTLVDGQWTPLDGAADKLVLCLTGISIGEEGGPIPSLLPVALDLAIIANFNGRTYATGLTQLSSVIGFLQSRRNFGGDELGVAPVTIDLVNPDPATIDRAMRMLGTPYLPAVFCKVGLSFVKAVPIQAYAGPLPAGMPKPGVYLAEPTGPQSVIGVQTAIPVFIGYTEKAGSLLEAVQLSSLADYESAFGAGPLSLHTALRLFYANGGSDCYVVSCGTTAAGTPVLAADLLKGLDAAARQPGPTMVVVPELCLLEPADYALLATSLLKSCASLQDRVAILDLPAGGQADSLYRAIGNGAEGLSYGVAYYPALQTADGIVPASGAIAGLWAQNDRNNGVWTAPVNLSLAEAGAPAVALTDAEQEALDTPLNGLAINAIRDFPGRGTVIWGALTLDGNSQDYQYIAVRRTLIYIEQSIRAGLQPMIFQPNTVETWSSVTAMIGGFLIALWSQGGLIGDKASDAFTVECGQGSTMTGEDVLNGVMKVTVNVALTHPAEFIELAFQQQMQS